MNIRTTIASEINEHHAIAIAKAGEAVHHAKEAGRLLLEVKAALPHGEFGKWMEQNITVSVRQAQRYIAVADAIGCRHAVEFPNHLGKYLEVSAHMLQHMLHQYVVEVVVLQRPRGLLDIEENIGLALREVVRIDEAVALVEAAA